MFKEILQEIPIEYKIVVWGNEFENRNFKFLIK